MPVYAHTIHLPYAHDTINARLMTNTCLNARGRIHHGVIGADDGYASLLHEVLGSRSELGARLEARDVDRAGFCLFCEPYARTYIWGEHDNAEQHRCFVRE